MLYKLFAIFVIGCVFGQSVSNSSKELLEKNESYEFLYPAERYRPQDNYEPPNNNIQQRDLKPRNVFGEIYELFVKIIGTMTKPFDEIMSSVWSLLTFYPRLIFKLIKLARSISTAVFKMIIQGGYSWMKIQKVIVDYTTEFQMELLDTLQAIFFPNNTRV